MSAVRFATGPKRPIRFLLGGEKNYFLIRGAQVVSRADGMLSIRGPEVSPGSLRAGTRRVQWVRSDGGWAPTPFAHALWASHGSQSSGSKSSIRSLVLNIVFFPLN